MFRPSKYQQAIFQAYQTQNSNILIDACPGSGKTTTLLQLSKFVKPYKKTRFFAFNVSIAENLQKKIHYPNISVSTLHSYGMSSLMKFMDCYLSESKIFHIAKQYSKDWKISAKRLNAYLFNISQLIQVYRLFLAQKTIESLQSLANLYDIDMNFQDLERTIQIIDKMDEYNNSKTEDKKMIDYTDMIYLPVLWDLKTQQFDELMVDEVQDLSILQYKLTQKALRIGGRGIFVGDPRQSIYSFLGANQEAFQNIQNQKNTLSLPLSVCYRCGSKITKFANNIYDVMESPEEQHEGEVRNGEISELRENDMVLCRNNKPLIELFLKLIETEKKCYIRGKDFGESLIRMVERIDHLTKFEAYYQFEERLREIIEELLKKGVSKPTENERYTNFKEKVDVIKLVGEKYSTLSEIIVVLKRIFINVKEEGICLSTIHKAKGLEADRTFIIRADLLPSKYATQEWQLTQERNLQFVAVTRPKQSLIFVKN